MIRIFKISLINGNNCPVLRSFVCDKVITQSNLISYKKRLKSVFQKRYGKSLNVDVKYCDVKSNYSEL